MTVRRGEIYWVDLEGSKGSEQKKKRPCVIIQSDKGNKNSPTTIVAPITEWDGYESFPFEVTLKPDRKNGLKKPSLVDLSQIRTASIKHRVEDKLGKLSQSKMEELEDAIEYSLGLD